MRVKVVLGAGLVAVAALVVVLLLAEDQRRAGSNYVPEHGPVTELDGGGRHCETEQIVPGDTGALRLLVGTYGPPTPQIDVTATLPGGAPVTRGRLPAGQEQGHVVIPLERVDDTTPGAEVCIRVGGDGRTVLYGRGENVRLAWMREGSESRLAILPVIAHRLGLAKLNPFGDWLVLVLVLVMGVAVFVALRTVLREVGP